MAKPVSLETVYLTTNNKKYIVLSLGEKKLLASKGHRILHIGNKNFASLSLKEGHLEILAKKQGQTYIRFGSKHYKIIVTDEKTKQHIHLVHNTIKDFWGLSWGLSKDNKIQILGTLNRMYDWVQIAKLAKDHGIQYEFKAQISEGLEPTIMKFFKSISENYTLPKLAWGNLPLAFIPQGEQLHSYQQKFKDFGLVFKKDKEWFHPSKMIEIEIAMLETNSSLAYSFGKAQSQISELSSVSSLLKALKLLSAKGKGEITYHSSTVVQHGEKISLENGGEIPFQQYNTETGQYTTHWKSYGFNFNIIAFADQYDNIKVSVEGSISEPVSTSITSGLIPIKKQSLKSSFHLKNKSIVNLFQQEKESSSNLLKGGIISSLPFINSIASNRGKNKVHQTIYMRVSLLEESKKAVTKKNWKDNKLSSKK